MARKERNSVDYFPHTVNHGKKMFFIRSKYKNDGYAVWFMLVEELGKAEYHYLDLSDDVSVMYLSSSMMVSEELLISIINDLVKLGEFDNKLWDDERILFNEKFIESIQDAYKKRNNKCVDKNSLLGILMAKGLLKHSKSIHLNPKSTSTVPGNPQRKEKKRKEDKIKPNNTILLSDLSESDLSEKYIEIAFKFWDLFKSNLAELGINNSTIEKAKLENWKTPIRLMFESDNRTKEEIIEVYNFLKNEIPENGFSWKQNILSTEKLRKQFEKLLIASRKIKQNGTGKQHLGINPNSGVSDDYKRSVLNRLGVTES